MRRATVSVTSHHGLTTRTLRMTFATARPICSRCQALRTNCVYEAQQGESRWSALRRRHKDVENDRDDLRELLSFLQMRPESEALHIFNRIRTGGFEDLLRLIRHAREDGHAISSQQLSSAPNAMDAGRLPSIQSMLSEPSHVDMQHHAEAGPSSTRQQRLPSFSSDGSGESYASSSLSSPSARP